MSGTEKGGNGERPLTGLERAKLERELARDKSPTSSPPTPAPVQPPLPSEPAVLLASLPQPAPQAANTAYVFAGPGVKIKGDIIECEMLRVEGTIEGTTDARQLKVCPTGSFLGTAEIEDAEIEGQFDGALNVHGKLLLRSTGRISGTLSYGEIEVERGGKIVGLIALNQTQDFSTPPPNLEQMSASQEERGLAGFSTLAALGLTGTAHHAASSDALATEPRRDRQTVQPQPARQSPPTTQIVTVSPPKIPQARPPTQVTGAPEPKARRSLFFGRGPQRA